MNPVIRGRVGRACGVAAAVLLAVSAGVRQLRAADRPDGPLPIGAKPVDFAAVHNVVRLSEKLYSGGVPEGEAGFEALRRFGIKTVITVDGAKPDVATARRFGMRYVHIPFGYDGCPAPTANAIAKAVRDLPGPVFLHCHHGKHRSPAGAAMARIALDGISNDHAARELERAGTGKNYTGLYGDVLAYKPPTKAELDALKVEFREIAKTPPMMEAMVQLGDRFEKLSLSRAEGWKAPNRHPKLDPAYEALQLQELYTELNRTDEVKRRAPDFREWMEEGERDGKALEAALRARRLDEASMLLAKVGAGCGGCHAKYRNVPQR